MKNEKIQVKKQPGVQELNPRINAKIISTEKS
jgi:hypothetical protein